MSIKKFIHDYIDKHVNNFNDQLFLRSDEAIIDQLEKIIISIQCNGIFTIKVNGFTIVDNYDDIQIILRNYYERILKNNKKAADENRFNYIDLQDSKIRLLIVHYEYAYKNERGKSDILIEVPRITNKFYFYLKGSYYYPMYQIVDASTYNNSGKKNTTKATITLKTNFQPIRITKYEVPVCDTEGNVWSFDSFSCFSFNKSVPAIIYLFAKYGIKTSLDRLGIRSFVYVSNSDWADENTVSFPATTSANNRIFININRQFINVPIIEHVAVVLLNAINSHTQIADLFTNDFWVEKLGEGFVSQKRLQKGCTVLKSFESTLDINIQEQLNLPWEYKKDMFSLLEWILCEFNNLKLKDTMNITTKKLRCAEYIAAMYAKKLASNIHRLSNKGNKISLKEIERTINIKPDWLITELAKSQLIGFRSIVNDMDSFLSTKFTYKGISGIGDTMSTSTGANGKKVSGANKARSIPNQFRFLDISNMGIIDPDSATATDPGVTGSIVPFLQLNTNGHLSGVKEPITYKNELQSIYNDYKQTKGLKEIIKFKHDILNDNTVTEDTISAVEQSELVINHIADILSGISESNNKILSKHLDALTGLPIKEGSDILNYDE
jgi:hypothetical protein